jgi:hypothetical protein
MHRSAHRSSLWGSRLHVLPATPLGRWAVWLAAVGATLGLVSAVEGFGGGLGFLSGLAGSVAALVAIVRRRERALTVYVALLLPGLFVIALVLADLLGHG